MPDIGRPTAFFLTYWQHSVLPGASTPVSHRYASWIREFPTAKTADPGEHSEFTSLRADITSLERQRDALRRLQELRKEIRALSEECGHLQTSIEANVEAQNADSKSLFSSVRIFFSEIVEDVIAHKALLSVTPNSSGHLEFRADILDEAGKATSAGLGHTYLKLLCIAFDLAVLRAHLDDKFPRFVYHDGVFESLDPRKKANLLKVIREYADLGVQPVISLIDADKPPGDESGEPVFAPDDSLDAARRGE